MVIFVVMTDRQTNRFLYPYACAWGNNNRHGHIAAIQIKGGHWSDHTACLDGTDSVEIARLF